MISAAGYVILYGVVAAISPLALTAMLAVVRSERPRTNGIAFLAGFLFGTTLGCVLGLILGQATVDRSDTSDTIRGLAVLLIGIALLVAGIRARRSPPPPPPAETSRGGAIMARLRHVGPGEALSMAGLLGLGGPKRLILTLLAMASIGDVDLGALENLTLVVLYIAVATSVVAALVGTVVVAGNSAEATIGRGEAWLRTNWAVLRVWLAIGLGAALVIDGLLRLVG